MARRVVKTTLRDLAGGIAKGLIIRNGWAAFPRYSGEEWNEMITDPQVHEKFLAVEPYTNDSALKRSSVNFDFVHRVDDEDVNFRVSLSCRVWGKPPFWEMKQDHSNAPLKPHCIRELKPEVKEQLVEYYDACIDVAVALAGVDTIVKTTTTDAQLVRLWPQMAQLLEHSHPSLTDEARRGALRCRPPEINATVQKLVRFAQHQIGMATILEGVPEDVSDVIRVEVRVTNNAQKFRLEDWPNKIIEPVFPV